MRFLLPLLLLARLATSANPLPPGHLGSESDHHSTFPHTATSATAEVAVWGKVESEKATITPQTPEVGESDHHSFPHTPVVVPEEQEGEQRDELSAPDASRAAVEDQQLPVEEEQSAAPPPPGKQGQAPPERAPLLVITGALGFVGAHACQQAIQRGYRVRAAVRGSASSRRFAEQLRQACYGGGQAGDEHVPHVHPTRIVDSPTAAAAPDGGKSSTEELPPLCGGKNSLEFVEVELDSPQPCWDAALDGAHACLHFASPIFGGRGSDLVGSCIQGAEKIVRACRNSGPEFALLVVCGSVQACNSGEDAEAGRQTEFTEHDWTSPNAILQYARAKMLAEKAAWRCADELQVPMTTILPTPIFGPTVLPRASPLSEAAKKLLERKVPLVPRVCWNGVDVRDVARLHLACVRFNVANCRLLCDSGEAQTFAEFADICRNSCAKTLGQRGWSAHTPPLVGPDWLFWALGLFDERIRTLWPMMGGRALGYECGKATALLKRLREEDEAGDGVG